MPTDSLYWLGTYQIESDGLHDCSMCSLILGVVRCDISGVYLIQISGDYWLTAETYRSTNLTISHILLWLIEVLGGKDICINKIKSTAELIFPANQMHTAGYDLCSIALNGFWCAIVKCGSMNGTIAIDFKISDWQLCDALQLNQTLN